MKESISQRIKSIRAKERLSQSVFAEALGIKQASLSDIERGKTEANYTLLFELSTKFSVNLNWLITGVGNDSIGYSDDNSSSSMLSEINIVNEINDNKKEIRYYMDRVMDIEDLLFIALDKPLDFNALEEYLLDKGIFEDIKNDSGMRFEYSFDYQKKVLYNEELKQTKKYLFDMFFSKFRLFYTKLSHSEVYDIIKENLNHILQDKK